jgi:uncharacterized repeat protein (TIGR03806 family)
MPVRSAGFLGFPEHAADAALAPQRLSETGAFADLATLEVSEGVLPYGVQSPLWSDGAYKARWLALPADGTVGFSAQGAWTFPEGTVFIKHFALALDESRPEELRRMETRFWIAARDGEFYGAVYKWNEEQRDAELLLDAVDEELTVLGSDGVARQQRYSFPAASACGQCHSESAGRVRGVRTDQLNGDFDYGQARGEPGTAVNQLRTLQGLGVFSEPIGEPAQYPHLVGIADESAPVEERVRSYWDSNCAMCHDDSPSSASWDARYQVPLAEQRVLMALPRSGAGPDDLRLIYPGDPERSLLYRRVNSDRPGTRMPPMLRNRVDAAYAELLRTWILSLPAP